MTFSADMIHCKSECTSDSIFAQQPKLLTIGASIIDPKFFILMCMGVEKLPRLPACDAISNCVLKSLAFKENEDVKILEKRQCSPIWPCHLLIILS